MVEESGQAETYRPKSATLVVAIAPPLGGIRPHTTVYYIAPRVYGIQPSRACCWPAHIVPGWRRYVVVGDSNTLPGIAWCPQVIAPHMYVIVPHAHGTLLIDQPIHDINRHMDDVGPRIVVIDPYMHYVDPSIYYTSYWLLTDGIDSHIDGINPLYKPSLL